MFCVSAIYHENHKDLYGSKKPCGLKDGPSCTGIFSQNKVFLFFVTDCINNGIVVQPQDTAVSGKVVQTKRKAYATISKGSMGLSEESVHELNSHMIKKKRE